MSQAAGDAAHDSLARALTRARAALWLGRAVSVAASIGLASAFTALGVVIAAWVAGIAPQPLLTTLAGIAAVLVLVLGVRSRPSHTEAARTLDRLLPHAEDAVATACEAARLPAATPAACHTQSRALDLLDHSAGAPDARPGLLARDRAVMRAPLEHARPRLIAALVLAGVTGALGQWFAALTPPPTLRPGVATLHEPAARPHEARRATTGTTPRPPMAPPGDGRRPAESLAPMSPADRELARALHQLAVAALATAEATPGAASTASATSGQAPGDGTTSGASDVTSAAAGLAPEAARTVEAALARQPRASDPGIEALSASLASAVRSGDRQRVEDIVRQLAAATADPALASDSTSGGHSRTIAGDLNPVAATTSATDVGRRASMAIAPTSVTPPPGQADVTRRYFAWLEAANAQRR